MAEEPLPIREFREGVSFRDFRLIAAREGWTVESILDRVGRGTFGGPASNPFYEPPAAYLTRVLRKAHAVDDDHVIPYRCLIALYVEATRLPKANPVALRRCACGCGSAVFSRQKYAAPDCRKRAQRRDDFGKVTDPENGPEMSPQNQGVKCDKNEGLDLGGGSKSPLTKSRG